MTLEPLPGGLALATAGAARYLAGTGAAEGAPRARAGDVRAVADGAALNRFLAGIERRAFAMARLATGSPDDALDLVQDAMIRLAERYGDRPEAEWAPLFFRILNNRITDHHRRGAVRRRFFGWLGPRDPEDESDPLESVPGPASDGPAERVALDGAMETLEGALEAPAPAPAAGVPAADLGGAGRGGDGEGPRDLRGEREDPSLPGRARPARRARGGTRR
ncbi:MAG: sigma factor [Pseudomonadales bacterium]|nr:sigma factor [Pseudomonadales bacterium]